MSTIKDVRGRQIFDSRGNPTVACEIMLDNGITAHGYVPSGATAGPNEALELRDNEPTVYEGRGVSQAVANVNGPIKAAVMGMDVMDLAAIDRTMIELDGTPNKSKLGANAILSVSLAAAKVASKSSNTPFYRYLANLMGKRGNKFTIPIPFLNILNGGKHAIGSTDVQEFMIVPVKFPSFKEAIRAGAEIYHALGRILADRSYQPLVGDEGGFAPALFSNEQAMELLMMAIRAANYYAGENVFIALDPAASRFYSDGLYQLHRENRSLTTQKMIDFYETWVEKYPIISIEDGLAENDWDGWRDLTQRIGDKVEIIGDDLYATNKRLLQTGIENHASTGILIKPNQIGTLTETLETIKMAENAGFKVMVSCRSGETEDTFIADLAVAAGCGAIKAGAPCRSERTGKYNRILEIEDEEGPNASYASLDTADNIGFEQL